MAAIAEATETNMRHVRRFLPPEACAGGTALNLRITGFAGAAISPDEVLSALDAVPARHLAGLREIGHHVYALAVSSKVKTQSTQRASRRSAPAGAYGASGPEGDFAESYGRYLEPGHKPRDFAAREGFMRDLVFCGDPWTLKERVAL